MDKKMRILLDTNVVLDFLLKRENYAPAAEIIASPIRTGMAECLTIISISDINFLAGKGSEPRWNTQMMNQACHISSSCTPLF